MRYSKKQKFYNLDETPETVVPKSFLRVLKWRLNATPEKWPSQPLADNHNDINNLVELRGDDCRITFINHATILIQWSSCTVLTDPVFSEKLGPSALFNIKRYRNPGIAFGNLPKIDYVFISHNHYDHLDLPSIKKILKRDNPQWIVPLCVGQYLPKRARTRTHELAWWESFQNQDVTMTLVPAQHWSKRGLFDTNQSLWGGAVISAFDRNIYFAGDTGYGAHFSLIRDRFGLIDVALLPIGAYEPRWFMKNSHMNPDEAVQAHIELGALQSIAIHFGTFRLSDEGIDKPVIDLKMALKDRDIPNDQFNIPKNGQSYCFKS